MNLPKKDKKGNSYLSYSQIQTFKRSREDYHNQYILNVPFEGNEYTEFGNKVGKALEFNDFTGFAKDEINVLSQVTRLDQFEKRVFLRYDEFYLIGFIDTASANNTVIIDYKTGGLNKQSEYTSKSYNQLQTYALSIRQETGTHVQSASVEFIRRKGNAFIGENLTVFNDPPLVIPQDLSEERLKHVYWDILKTAKEIEKFYKENK
jgi:hypothetical protein